MRIIVLVIALLFLESSPPVEAGVTFTSDTGVCNLALSGMISPIDITELKQIVESRNCQFRQVSLFLDSPGGDVETAIQLGRYLRDQGAWTGVSQQDTCASACVLVLLGGVTRTVFGSVGLHRPYSEQVNTSIADSRATYQRINQIVSDYLLAMNVPLRLLDEMNAVSPGDIRWVEESEMISLHIKGNDPVDEDIRASSNAGRLGISKQEYYRRDRLSVDICDGLPNDGTLGACFDSVMKTGDAPK